MIPGRHTALPALILTLALITTPGASQDLSPEANLDIRLFRAINGTLDLSEERAFDYVDRTSVPIFFSFPVVYTTTQTLTRNHGLDNSGLLLIFTQSITFGMTTGIKHLLCRDRPFEALDNVKVRERPSPGDPSFPSGHASQAFAIATFLSMRHPQAAVMIPSFLWAGAVGYARVYLGYHYPSDVLGGMVLGAGIAWIVWQNREGIVRWKKRTFGGQNVAITSQREWRGFEIFRLTVPISDVR